MRLFADDSSLFTCVKGVNLTRDKLVKDLQAVTSWAYQWKMVFNPDMSKQAIEVIFSCKKHKPDHLELNFNGIPIAREPFTKHLGVYLDSRLNFSKHIKEQILKAMKGVSLLKFLSKYVDRNVLDLSYKMYVRPHLDYGDVILHNQRMDLMELVERVQYKAAFFVSGCWQGTSREKLYDELGWESLSDRRWARRLTIFYKIHNDLAPSYLTDHIPRRNIIDFHLRNRNENPPLSRTQRYENSFFPYTIKSWKNRDNEAKSKPSVQSFKCILMTSFDPLVTLFSKFVTYLGLNYSQRSESVSQIYVTIDLITISSVIAPPACLCGLEDETSVHFFLCCPLYLTIRSTLLSKISDIISADVTVLPDEHLYHILIYGSNVYNSVCNRLIITKTITYIRKSGRFTNLEAFE